MGKFCAEMKLNLSFGTSHEVAVVPIGFKWYPVNTSITPQIIMEFQMVVDNHDEYYLNK